MIVKYYGRSFNVADSGGSRMTFKNEKFIRWCWNNWVHYDDRVGIEKFAKVIEKHVQNRLKDVYLDPKVQWEKSKIIGFKRKFKKKRKGGIRF